MSDELMELPEGWKWTQVSEVSELISGQHILSEDYSNEPIGISYLTGPADFSDRSPVISKWTTKPKVIANRDDVLVTVKGNGVGKTNILDIEEAAISRQLMAIRATEAYPSYFFHFFQANFENLQRLGTGSTVPGIDRESILSISIPLPPLNEQKRIVAAIDSLRNRTQDTRSALSAIPELCDKFRQSVLAAAFRGDLTADWREQNPDVEPAASTLVRRQESLKRKYQENCEEAKRHSKRKPSKPSCLNEYVMAWEDVSEIPSTWITTAMGTACWKVTDGTHDTPKPSEKGVPYVTAQHIRNSFIDFENAFCLSQYEHDIIYARCNPEKGDVLLVSIGAGTATPAYVDVDFEFSLKNVALLKPDLEILDGKYLEYHQIYMKPNIYAKVSRGGAQAFLSLKLIREIPLILPPISEQKEIVRRISNFFKSVELFEKQYQSARNYLEPLDRSILAKAFRGELVEQDPNDEPASVLLNRIRAEREQQAQTTSNRRKRGLAK